MSCGCTSVPTFGVLNITITGTTATINLDGALPVSGRFNVRVCGCCLDVCSGDSVVLVDAVGTTLGTVLDKCGNAVRLNKIAVQARKHRCLHFCRSIGTNIAMLQDYICAPTPVIDNTDTVAAASETTQALARAALG